MIARLVARAGLVVLCLGSGAASAGPAALHAAKLVPAAVDAALLLDGAEALAGPRAFFTEAGRLAPALQPGELGRLLQSFAGVDLLAAAGAQDVLSAEPRQLWGLADQGPRAVVLSGKSVGTTLPIARAADARKALELWLGEAGRPKRASFGGVRGRAAGRGKHARAGALVQLEGADRLVLASGEGAQKLAAALAALPKKRAALAGRPELAQLLLAAKGGAVVYLAGVPPLRAAVLSLAGTPEALSAEGVLLPSSEPLLAGPPAAAPACDGDPLFCARAGLGAGGRRGLALLLRQWAAQAFPGRDAARVSALTDQLTQAMTGPAALRVESVEVQRLGAFSNPLWAAPFTAAALQSGLALAPPGLRIEGPRPFCLRAGEGTASLGDECERPQPQLSAAAGETDSVAALDAHELGRELNHASPLSALRGPLPAGAYTARLLFGRLLDASGPLTARARPLPEPPGAAALELRWPLTVSR